MTNVPRNALQILERVQKRLKRRKGQLGRWEDVAREIGASIGTTVRVANGYYPRHPDLCKKFDLPPLGEGIICPVHGKVCAVRHRLPKKAANGRPKPKRIYIRKPLNTVWPENTIDF